MMYSLIVSLLSLFCYCDPLSILISWDKFVRHSCLCFFVFLFHVLNSNTSSRCKFVSNFILQELLCRNYKLVVVLFVCCFVALFWIVHPLCNYYLLGPSGDTFVSLLLVFSFRDTFTSLFLVLSFHVSNSNTCCCLLLEIFD